MKKHGGSLDFLFGLVFLVVVLCIVFIATLMSSRLQADMNSLMGEHDE